MTTAATITARLTLDSADYDRGMKGAEKKASSLQNKLKSVGSTMASVGTKLTAGLTVPLVAAGGAMVKAASDLEESGNAVNVVFGDAKGILEDYAKTVSTTAGLSRAEFNQISAVTGAFLKNVGFNAAEAAKQTITLTERAADMASIFNTDVSQALNAIQSGLKGEFNPLEQFGVKLNAAAIEAKAMAMGLADANGEIDDAAKAQAALALVMEQTDQFAGDFVNTSDGLANSTKILKAQFTDMAAELGTKLLPAGLKVVGFLSDLIDKFANLSDGQQNAVLAVAGIAAAIGPLTTIIGGLVSAVGAVGPIVAALTPVFAAVGAAIAAVSLPVIALIAAIGLLVYLIVTQGKKVWVTIQQLAAIVVFAFVKMISIVFDFGVSVFKMVSGVINSIKNVLQWIGKMASKLGSIKLPGFLMPGSPTPFEIGLVGIGGAIKDINATLSAGPAGKMLSPQRESSGVSIQVNNPAPEPATRSINREMKKLSYLGIAV